MEDEALGNAAYYRKREEMERLLADEALADDIRNVHLQLASRYAHLADEFEAQGPGARR